MILRHASIKRFGIKIIGDGIHLQVFWHQDHRGRHLHDTAMLRPDHAQLGGVCPCGKIGG
jgi:hypothetical protein